MFPQFLESYNSQYSVLYAFYIIDVNGLLPHHDESFS